MPRRDALKLLPHDWSADAEYRARFNREADLASTLWHPHIVGVHDRGEEDGQLWISMDFVDGLDAARLLADRYPAGMPVEEVARIVTAVARALDYAHKQGLLHRDVKPANIMMTHLDDEGEQRILLTDFGIARNVNDISGLTKTNMTVGTVAYCAPEQLLGEDIDGRADQYSLAATAFPSADRFSTVPALQPRWSSATATSMCHHRRWRTVARSLPSLTRFSPSASPSDPKTGFKRCSDFARALSEQINRLVRRHWRPRLHRHRCTAPSLPWTRCRLITTQLFETGQKPLVRRRRRSSQSLVIISGLAGHLAALGATGRTEPTGNYQGPQPLWCRFPRR